MYPSIAGEYIYVAVKITWKEIEIRETTQFGVVVYKTCDYNRKHNIIGRNTMELAITFDLCKGPGDFWFIIPETHKTKS